MNRKLAGAAASIAFVAGNALAAEGLSYTYLEADYFLGENELDVSIRRSELVPVTPATTPPTFNRVNRTEDDAQYNAEGFRFEASVLVHDNIFLTFGYAAGQHELDDELQVITCAPSATTPAGTAAVLICPAAAAPNNVVIVDEDSERDVESTTFGVGGRYPLMPDFDVFGVVRYVAEEVQHNQAVFPANSTTTAFDDSLAFPITYVQDDDTQNGLGVDLGIRGVIANLIEVEGTAGYVDLDEDQEIRLSAEGRYWFYKGVAVTAGVDWSDDGALVWRLGARLNLSDR